MREKTQCRLCNGSLRGVFGLKSSPVANSYPERPDAGADRYPMELMACNDCGHVQQRFVLDGLFVDYKYQTPQTVATYLMPVAEAIADACPGGRVLEIGCNNGVFLDCLVSVGMEPVGVDPATTHPLAIRDYFTSRLADKIGTFNVIVGNNVFAHIDDLQDVFRGVERCLEPDGVFVFEVQYLVDLVKSGAFDMIYHEHLDYHTVGPLARFLRAFGLVLTRWEHIPTHGGSIRLWARKAGEECELPAEALDWDALREKVESVKASLTAELEKHGKVVAFGASAKASTLINQLGIERFISFVVDDTPHKQFRFIPGTNIPINPVHELVHGPVLLTAWNYEKEIAERLPGFELINPFRCASGS